MPLMCIKNNVRGFSTKIFSFCSSSSQHLPFVLKLTVEVLIHSIYGKDLNGINVVILVCKEKFCVKIFDTLLHHCLPLNIVESNLENHREKCRCRRVTVIYEILQQVINISHCYYIQIGCRISSFYRRANELPTNV